MNVIKEFKVTELAALILALVIAIGCIGALVNMNFSSTEYSGEIIRVMYNNNTKGELCIKTDNGEFVSGIDVALEDLPKYHNGERITVKKSNVRSKIIN